MQNESSEDDPVSARPLPAKDKLTLCFAHAAYRMQERFDLRGTGIRSIEVRDGLSRQNAMRSLNEVLSQRYVVDVVDSRAGFAMTTWQASLVRDGVPDPRYRTRFVARFVDEWKSLQLRSEARFTRTGEPDVGYDSAQLDSLANDVRAKLGKKQ